MRKKIEKPENILTIKDTNGELWIKRLNERKLLNVKSTRNPTKDLKHKYVKINFQQKKMQHDIDLSTEVFRKTTTYYQKQETVDA